ncbi:MAG TPA: hypothetical protein VKQ27_03225 [Acetobacteraceae bacterium]|nr:hypothetical protein [Acetobacteraceae bacterium]
MATGLLQPTLESALIVCWVVWLALSRKRPHLSVHGDGSRTSINSELRVVGEVVQDRARDLITADNQILYLKPPAFTSMGRR